MKSKIKRLLPLILLVVAFLAVTLLIHFNSHNIFVFFESNGIFLDPVSFEKNDEANFSSYALSELESDGRVTFDQSLMLVNTEIGRAHV